MNFEDHQNRAKWVCQSKDGACGGVFVVKGQRKACPLWPSCGGGDPGLETSYPVCGWKGTRCCAWDPNHRKSHDNRRAALRQAFTPERVLATQARYREIHRDIINAKVKYRRDQDRLTRLGQDLPAPSVPPPPCGGDCEDNCPFDGACPYADWEDVYLAQEEEQRRRAQAEQRTVRQKERQAMESPEEREVRLAHRREISQRSRARQTPQQKEERRAKDRAAWGRMSPEKRDARNARRRERYAANKDAINAGGREKRKEE